jgi:hypothetical protein
MLTIKQIIAKFKHEETVTPQLLLCMEGMRERNEARIEAIKAEMGEKYILHKSHTKSRLDEPRPV